MVGEARKRQQARQQALSVPSMKKHARNYTIRLLVCGERQVGKSATIVRYTTDRFIEEYCRSTDDWLYRHWLGLNQKVSHEQQHEQQPSEDEVQVSIEIMEQKDIPFSSASDILDSLTNATGPSSARDNTGARSLSSRVACEQELRERQELLQKLHWANAYLIVYSIDRDSSFEKAALYLSLIHQHQQRELLERCSPANRRLSDRLPASSRPLNTILSSNSQSSFDKDTFIGQDFGPTTSATSKDNNNNNKDEAKQNCRQAIRKPSLLMANKLDLAPGARQVTFCQGQFKAMDFDAMFAEVSVALSTSRIDSILSRLLEQVRPSDCSIQLVTARGDINTTNNNNNSSNSTIQRQPLRAYQLRRDSPPISRQYTDDNNNSTQFAFAGALKADNNNNNNNNSMHQFGLPTIELALATPVYGQLVRSATPLAAGCGLVCSSRVEQRAIRGHAMPTGTDLAKATSSSQTRFGSLDSNATDCSASLASEACLPLSLVAVAANDLPYRSVGSVSSNGKSLASNQQQASGQQATTRYKSLKSSFKRASMAIVSSRSLLRETRNKQQLAGKPIAELAAQATCVQLASLTNQLASLDHHSQPFQRAPLLFGQDQSFSPAPLVPSGSRLKRTLFKYKERCRTVAFASDSFGLKKVSPKGSSLALNGQQQHQLQQLRQKQASQEECRSSSSLSNSLNDSSRANYGSNCYQLPFNPSGLHVVSSTLARSNSDRASSSASGGSSCATGGSSYSPTQHHCQTTVGGQQYHKLQRQTSRASTSAGSHDESANDEHEPPPSYRVATSNDQLPRPALTRIVASVIDNQKKAQPDASLPAEQRRPTTATQIVKTFSSYLAASAPRQAALKQRQKAAAIESKAQAAKTDQLAAKKGFCSGLFKPATGQPAQAKALNSKTKVQVAELNAVEHPTAHLVGYCK